MNEKDKILSEIMSAPIGTSNLWWGHRTAPTPTSQQVTDVVNTPLTELGPGPNAVYSGQGSITSAAPASAREQTQKMLQPVMGKQASRGFTGSQDAIGVADFVPGLGTPAAVSDFMHTREKVKTGEAGALDYGLTGAGIALSAVPGGVAAKKLIQKGVSYSSKLMDQVLDRTKNAKETMKGWEPTGKGIQVSPKDHPDDANLVEETTKLPFLEKDVKENYTFWEEHEGSPSPFQYASEVKRGSDVTADPISKAQIKSEIVNKGDVLKQDRALMERALGKVEGDKIDPVKLAKAVDEEVVPLKQKLTTQYADYDTSSRANTIGGDFNTVIYQGPLYHGADNHFGDPYYFAHTRRQDLKSIDGELFGGISSEDMQLRFDGEKYNIVDTRNNYIVQGYSDKLTAQQAFQEYKEILDEGANNGVRRILEIQSDALQKRHNVQEILNKRHGDIEGIEEKISQFKQITPDMEELREAVRKTNYKLSVEDKDFLRYYARKLGTTIDGLSPNDAVEHVATSLTKRLAELETMKMEAGKAAGFTEADRMIEYQNLWQYRVAREEIKQAAKDGKKEVWFPTGPTAARIENWDSVNNLHQNRATTVDDDVADVFVEDPDNPFAGAPMVKNNVPMASDPEIHELISRKGNPYKNELIYLEDSVRRDKEEIEYYTKQIEKYSKEGVYYSPGDKERLIGYKQALEAHQQSVKTNTEALEKLKSQSKNNVPESKYYGLYNMYQDLSKWLSKEFKAERVTDSEGLSWVKVKINPEQANEPVRAFKSTAPFLVGAGAAAAATQMQPGEAKAHHEQSETVQRPDGKWINVYGEKTKNAGKQLPGTPAYNTVEEAVEAAKKRSEEEGKKNLIKRRGTNERAN
jgi:hypothetical protein